MKHVLAVVAVALVVSLALAPVASAQEKWVRGNVVTVAGDTLVVRVLGKDMSFKIDPQTVLTARGAGRAQQQAEAQGAAGVKLVDFIKPGGGAEVHYKDVGGTMTAVEIFSVPPVKEGAASPAETSGGSARGTVTAVGAASVTVKGSDKEWTFAVDPKTAIVGTGLGTITREFKAQNKVPTITDLLSANDRVIVYFQEAGGALKASEIRVTQKAMK
jgi:hypothetical protein